MVRIRWLLATGLVVLMVAGCSGSMPDVTSSAPAPQAQEPPTSGRDAYLAALREGAPMFLAIGDDVAVASGQSVCQSVKALHDQFGEPTNPALTMTTGGRPLVEYLAVSSAQASLDQQRVYVRAAVQHLCPEELTFVTTPGR